MLAVLLASAITATPVPLRLTADVDDAYAPLVNPGGLGLLDGAELRLIYGRSRIGEVSDLALLGALRLGPMALAVSAAWDNLSGDAVYRPTVGLGFGGDTVGVGVSWTRIDEDRGTWGLGITWRPSRRLSIAFASLDVGQTAGSRPYDIGLATRLFDERLLVSARWRLLHGEPVQHDDGRADVRFLVGLETLTGVTLSASADLHFRPSIQLTVDVENVGVSGGVSRVEDSGPAGFFGEIAVVSRDQPTLFVPSRVAVLELTGDLTPSASFDLFDGGFDDPIYGGIPLLLEAISREDDVKGVLLKIGDLSLGWGRLEEVRDGITALRASGRHVDCVLSAAGDAEIWLASACDRVAVLHSLPIDVDGVSASFVFLGDALDQLGVTPQVVKRGAYKNAPDMFTLSGMSPAQREVADALLDQAWSTLQSGIVEGRKITPENVEEIVALGTLTGTQAKDLRLVDEVLYPDELEEWVRKHYDGSVAFIQGESLPRPDRRPWGHTPQIALITIDSAITSGESGDLPFGLGGESGAETIVRALEAAKNNSDVRAVVLRIESPGGDAIASDLIARAVKKVNEVKPVIASMGDVAASGGYYVAAPARFIYANKGTITGSIGIFSLGFSVEKLLSKLGIHSESMYRGEAADRGNPLIDQTESERRVVEREIDNLYRQFLSVVADGRKKSVADVRAVAEGHVWTGEQAKARGLVDELGGLIEAIERARIEGGLALGDQVHLSVLPSRRANLPDAVRNLVVGDDPFATFAARLPPMMLRVARIALGLPPGTRGAAMLPFVVDVR